MVAQASSATFPVVGLLTPSLQAVSSQPTAVPSLGPLSIPRFPAPRPPLYQGTHDSCCGVQGCGTDHEHSSYFVLPSTDWLLHSPPIPRRSLSVPADFPTVSRAFLSAGTSLHLQLPARGAGPFLFPLFFFSSFHPMQLRGDFSCPFRCPRSSTSVQQVFCEIHSICRCILDILVR